jgi:hypothetical protein
MATTCPVCNGRTIKASTGVRCMKSDCEGNAKLSELEGIMCEECLTEMDFKGLNSWGEPNYTCPACHCIVKL